MADFYGKTKDSSYRDTFGDIHADRYDLWRKVMFSDVSNFDSNNYAFFTHSVKIRRKSDEFYRGYDNSDSKYSPDTDSFDIAFNPYDLSKKKRISVALTTSDDNYTYGRIGYIVGAPVENILYVGQAPFGKSNDELRSLPLKTPEDAKEDEFREVVLEGKTMYGTVKPVAIFVNLSDATEEEISETMDFLEQIREATGGAFPVLDLSSKDYRMRNGSGKKI